MPARKRLAVVSNDHVGSAMAGPGIRYYHFARELARRFDVTLFLPEQPDIEIENVAVGVWRGLRRAALRELLLGFDVVVAQHLSPLLTRDLARSRVRVIYDLYDPYLLENLGFYAEADTYGAAEQAEHRAGATLQEIALAAGDAFVCASERQRDLWLGVLGTLDRIDVQRYRDDENLRGLIDVVPFGMEAEPPRRTAAALKGVVPGIARDDHVLLWGGGVWNWLDPLTPIRAVARLTERRSDVKLYFLGLQRPNPEVAQMRMARRAVELADELGLRERHVFFNFGWVPYSERHNYLLEADVGISAHLDTVEARFAFRTRIVDYFWAGLPVLATTGDTLAALVEERNLGRTLEFGDVEGWVSAIEELLDDARTAETAKANIASVREEFMWPRLVDVLARIAEAPVTATAAPRVLELLVLRHFGLRSRTLLARLGPAGFAKHIASSVARRAGLIGRAPQPATRK